MGFPTLQPGDIVAVNTRSILAKSVAWLTKLWSKDNQSWANHALFMKDCEDTFESEITVRSQNLLKHYGGKRAIIGRLEGLTPQYFDKGWTAVSYMKGKWYPVPRLLLFLVPFLPKYFVFSKIFGFGLFSTLVCSEMVGLFCCKAERPGWENYRGLTPDDIADRITNWRRIKVIFNGKLPSLE